MNQGQKRTLQSDYWPLIIVSQDNTLHRKIIEIWLKYVLFTYFKVNTNTKYITYFKGNTNTKCFILQTAFYQTCEILTLSKDYDLEIIVDL